MASGESIAVKKMPGVDAWNVSTAWRDCQQSLPSRNSFPAGTVRVGEALMRVLLLAALLAPACHGPARSDARPNPTTGPHGEAFRVAIEQKLPAMDGSRLKISVYEVSYQPGGFSAPHRHRCPVIGYVTTGALRSQSAGGQETIYRAGDAFYEEANTAHLVSADASKTEPVTFLAFFLCDRAGPQTVPDSSERSTRAR